MSTWTSDRVRTGLFVAVFLGLAACGGRFEGTSRAASSAGTGLLERTQPGERETTLGSAAIRVAGPVGYCIDPSSRKDTGATSFVLLGSCSGITGSARAASPDTPAILTASVGDGLVTPMSDQLPQMDAYLRSEAGRGALSRTGNPQTVTVMESFTFDEALFLRVRDNSPSEQEGVEDEYWRAILDVKSMLVTLSVLGLDAAPLSADQGLSTLRAYVSEVRGLNTPFAAPPVAAGPVQAPAPTPDPVRAAPSPPRSPGAADAFRRIGLFRRLLG